ncbi:MAG: TolB-like 6-bladed beta-propeller domain-containing protein [Clostridium sp.]|nr:TolB-like 6-bladed beta-propeller domain-containing protein [Clostridium sp.]
MMKTNICGVLVCLFTSMLIVSCDRIHRDVSIPSYVETNEIQHIKGDTILENAMSQMYRPYDFWLFGDSIVFLDFDGQFVYSLVSVSGDSLIGRLISKGDGPGQLIRSESLQVDSEDKVYLFDDVKNKIYNDLSLANLINGLDTVEALRFEEVTGSKLWKTERGYVGDNLYGDGHIMTLFDNNGNVRSRFGLVPGTHSADDLYPDFYMAYQIKSAVSPDKKYLCAAGAYHDWLAFFDVSGDTPKLIREYYSSAPVLETGEKDGNFHSNRLPETIHQYSSVNPTKKGVLLDYLGVSDQVLKAGKSTHQILYYDWDGNLKNVFSIDEKIYDMTFEPDGSILATFKSDNDEIRLIRYTIPSIHIQEIAE